MVIMAWVFSISWHSQPVVLSYQRPVSRQDPQRLLDLGWNMRQ